MAKGIKIQIWRCIWIGGRSELEFIRDPITITTLNSTRYIRRILSRHVKKAIRRGKLYNSIFTPFSIVFNS